MDALGDVCLCRGDVGYVERYVGVVGEVCWLRDNVCERYIGKACWCSDGYMWERYFGVVGELCPCMDVVCGRGMWSHERSMWV